MENLQTPLHLFRLFLFLLFTFFQKTVFAQLENFEEIEFETLSTKDGLPHSSINCMASDSMGFLWIGTVNGLSRYDGKIFENFFHNPLDSTSVPHDGITAIHIDQYGIVWIGTQEGMAFFQESSQNFQRINLPIYGDQRKFITKIKEIGRERIFLSTYVAGILELKFKREKDGSIIYDELISAPLSNDKLSRKSITDFDLLNDNELIIASSQGLFKFNIQNDSLFEFKVNQKFGSNVKSIAVSLNKSIWINVLGKGLFELNNGDQEFKKHNFSADIQLSFNQKDIENLFFDDDNLLWLTSLGIGLLVLDIESKKSVIIQNEKNNEKSLKTNNTLSFFNDENGIILIGTQGEGINYILPSKQQFNLQSQIDNISNEIFKNNTTSIFEDSKNNLWVACRNIGIYKSKIRNDYKKCISTQFYSSETALKKSINHNLVFSIFEKQDGSILLGSRNGLNIYDPFKNEIRNYYHNRGDLNLLMDKTIYCISETKKGQLYMGSSGGVFMYNEKTESLQIIDLFKNKEKNSNSVVHKILEEDNGNLWFVGINLFLKFDLETNEVIDFNHTNLDAQSPDFLTDAIFDENENIWITSYGNGIYKFDIKDNKIKNYSIKEGLRNAFVYKIQADSNGKIWLSTNKGLSLFNPQSEKFYNIGTEYGLQGEEFNSRAGFKSKTNEILGFGGTNGVNFFDPTKIELDTVAPDIYFKSISKHSKTSNGNQIQKIGNLNKKELITLHHSDFLLQIDAAAPQFPTSNDLEYAYQLGEKNEWIILGSKSDFSFTNLPSGSYKLKVKVRKREGQWNPKYAELYLRVYPPWWYSWWAFVLYGLSIIVVFLSIYKYRIRQLMKYQNLRTRISSDLHDEVGSTLSSLAMEAEMLKINRNSNGLERLERLEELSREAMTSMRDTVWAIDSRKDTVESLSNRMDDYLFDQFKNLEKRYKFSKNLRSSKTKIPPDQRQNFYLVFKEAIINFLKHSKGDLIEVKLIQANNKLKLQILDNGEVNPSMMKNSGLGLSNMKLRAENIGAELNINTERGFEICFEK